MAMLCSVVVLADTQSSDGLLISPNPVTQGTPQTQPTQEEINKAATGFTDVAPDAPYVAAIKKLVEYGIIAGYPDGTFKPEGEVTRAEMCKMINLALGYTDIEGAAGFPDVSYSRWYYTYALAAQKQGYVEGYEDGTFRGSNNITRQEVCAILNRLLKPMNLGIPVVISDTVSNWARPHVELIVQNFIMPLEENNTFRATENLKRHELATVLSNMAIGPVQQKEADIRFFVNGEQYGETQTVTIGGCATAPQEPPVPASDYIFDGWRVIGTNDVIDISGTIVTADVDYEAVFAKKLHDVNFYSRGAYYDSRVVAHGDMVEAPKNPSVKGYDFVGWSLSENGEIVKLSATKIVENVNFYAVFEKQEEEEESGGSTGGGGGGAPTETKSFTVRFFVNGDVYEKLTVNKNQSPKAPKDPELEGYIFLGWSFEPEGDIVFVDAIKVTSGVTLYARFEKEAEPEPEVFTVTFYADGKVHDTQFVENGNKASNVSEPEKDGYIFKHWSKTEGGAEVKVSYYTVTSDTKFYAVFEKEEEEIVYRSVSFIVDGKSYWSTKVQDGNKVTSPEAPLKDGYTFKGWSRDEGGSVVSISSVTVNEDLTFYAVFEKIEPKKYTVTFYAFGKVHDVQTVLENETVNLPKNPEHEAYIFVGWSDKLGGEVIDVGSIPITYSRAFYVKVADKPQKKYYTITFVSDGKTVLSSQIEEGKEITVPKDPVKADHEFLGWAKSEGGSVVTVDNVANGDLTYYAVFKEIKKYNVTFYVNGKSFKETTVIEGETTSAPSNPSVEGYNFLGWSKTEGGSKVDVGSVKITKDTVFYAILEEKEPEKVYYNVTFISDGKTYDSQSVLEGSYAKKPTDPDKDNYTFKGWATKNGGAVVNVSSVVINAKTTFYAVFEKNPVYYEVVFMVFDEEYDVQEVLEGECPEEPLEPVAEGFVFLGWSNTENGTTVYPDRNAVRADTTYYAVFEEEEEEIIFYDVFFYFDGEYYMDYEVAAGETVTPPEIPELEEGVTFLGWSLDDNNDPEKIIEVSDLIIEGPTDIYSVLAKNPNSAEFMEKMERGYKQLKKIRVSGLQKDAIDIIKECIGYVIDDAKSGVFIDKNYVGNNYGNMVSDVKRIVNVDMTSTERSGFVNTITDPSRIDQDVQDFLIDYFDIDTSI